MDGGMVVFGCFGLASVVAIVAIYFGRSVSLKAGPSSQFEVSTVSDSSDADRDVRSQDTL